MKGYESTTLSAYKRTPSLGNSTWYKGILISQMAGTSDNDGAFDLVVSKMRRGTEPPPHVRSREHEVFYILSGAVIVYRRPQGLSCIRGRVHVSPTRRPSRLPP